MGIYFNMNGIQNKNNMEECVCSFDGNSVKRVKSVWGVKGSSPVKLWERHDAPDDPYAVAPEKEHISWNYTLNEAAGTITLNRYIGNYYAGKASDVIVYSNYKVNGRTYHTKIKSNNNQVNNNGDYMFAYCSDRNTLKTITFGDNIDFSEATNMRSMFYGCNALQSIDFGGNFNTENVTNMSHMFDGCISLIELDLKNFKTGSVTDMSYMFYACWSLTELDLRNFDTSNVTDMQMMFRDCKSLESIYLGNGFVTGKVTNMNGMFLSCVQLGQLELSGFDVQNVTNMGDMFGHTLFDEVDISNWNTENVVNMAGMFGGMKSLKSVDMNSLYLSNVTDFGSMFHECSSLISVNFDNTVLNPVRKSKNMKYMFMDCSSLESLNLSSWDIKDVHNMEQMFFGCTNLKAVYATKDKWVVSGASGNMFTNCGTSSVTYV